MVRTEHGESTTHIVQITMVLPYMHLVFIHEVKN